MILCSGIHWLGKIETNRGYWNQVSTVIHDNILSLTLFAFLLISTNINCTISINYVLGIKYFELETTFNLQM